MTCSWHVTIEIPCCSLCLLKGLPNLSTPMCRGIPRHPRRTCMLPHSKLRLVKDQTDPCGIPRHLWRLLCHRPSFKTKLLSGDGIGIIRLYQGVYQKLPWLILAQTAGSDLNIRRLEVLNQVKKDVASQPLRPPYQREPGNGSRGVDFWGDRTLKDSIRKVDSVPNHQKPSILERYTIYYT